MATASFAAGCFWGVEESFRNLPGVTATEVGYTGGHLENPSYRQVCRHRSGHAEAVRVQYDALQISYERLLEAFFAMHDPTQLNRQGPDRGSQYRSAIFYETPEQEQAARRMKDRLQASGAFKKPVVTEILPASTFWRAEEYHQRYFEKNGLSACHSRSW
jgi:peptide-methionine (S)-S-oxide reductase